VSKKKTSFHRIILKISGESFSSSENLKLISGQIIEAHKSGAEIGVVVGGGNVIRGKNVSGIDRKIADRIGLISTIINGLLLENSLKKSAKVTHLSSFPISGIVKTYSQEEAIDRLKSRHVLILSGGTGSLYFTTDTAAALRAAELGADVIIKGTKVDGVYSADPQKNPKAIKYDRISYAQVLNRDIKVMDSTAFALCQENKIPIIVINIFQTNNLKKVLSGKKIGSIIC
jgi:uridylate kinase